MSDDVYSTTARLSQLSVVEISYRQAINKIRSEIRSASNRGVHIYSYKVRPEQLEPAYKLLDKVDRRKIIRVTYSDDCNFVIRYMPSSVHEMSHVYWSVALGTALTLLTPPPHAGMSPGCLPIGSTTYQLGQGKMEPDSGVKPENSSLPSVIIEVGDSESITQLKIDARLWIEHMPEVQLVTLVSIDHPPKYPEDHHPIVEGSFP